MRTVSSDDLLTEPGANPRTGIVSPFVVSDSSEESVKQGGVCGGGDYIDLRAGSWPNRRSHNGKWKQDDFGWSFGRKSTAEPNSTKYERDKSPSVHQAIAG